MEVGGYRLRQRKEQPVRSLPLYWYIVEVPTRVELSLRIRSYVRTWRPRHFFFHLLFRPGGKSFSFSFSFSSAGR